MTPHTTAAYGMYARNIALPEVVFALNEAGFGSEDICIVLSPAHPDAASVRDATIWCSGSDSATSERMIRWFSKFGAVVIPTVGLFIRSQQFLQALMTEQSFPKLSRGSRTLLGLGFSHDDAARLGHLLSDFGALVYVTCTGGNRNKVDGAIELLRSVGAREAAGLQHPRATGAAA